MKRFACGARPLPQLVFEVNNLMCSDEKPDELFLENIKMQFIKHTKSTWKKTVGGATPPTLMHIFNSKWFSAKWHIAVFRGVDLSLCKMVRQWKWGKNICLEKKGENFYHPTVMKTMHLKVRAKSRKKVESESSFFLLNTERSERTFQFFSPSNLYFYKKIIINDWSHSRIKRQHRFPLTITFSVVLCSSFDVKIKYFVQIKQLLDSSATAGPPPLFLPPSSSVISVTSH